MSQEAKQLLLEIRQNLSTIFGNSTLLNELKNNKDFQKTIERQIAVHKKLESICKEEFLLTDKYSENFKNITNAAADVDKFKDMNDIDEITDQVNYLNVVSKNLFNKKMSEFQIDINNNVNLNDDKKTILSSDNKTSEKLKDGHENKTSKSDEPLKGEHVRAENFNQNNGGKTNGFNPNLFGQQNQAYDVQPQAALLAQKRLQIELEMGKIYRWKEKQKSVLFLQYIAVAFSLIFLLATSAALIALIYGIINDFSIQNPTTPTNYFSLKNSAFGVIFPVLIVFFVGVYLVVKYLNDSQGKLGFMRKKKVIENAAAILDDPKMPSKNENLMYHFQVSAITIAFIFYLIFTLIPFSITFSPLYFLISPEKFSNSPSTSGMVSGPIKDAIFYSFIVYYASFIPLVIIFGLSFKMNPQLDVDRLNSILEKYINELQSVSGGGIPPFPGGGFGRGPGVGPFGF